MAQRAYSMTLPLGTRVEVTITGPALIAGANSLFMENGKHGWTYEDCLAMRALSSMNGLPVADLNAAMALDTKEYIALRDIVVNLVAPGAQQLQDAIGTLVLLDSYSSEGSLDATATPL